MPINLARDNCSRSTQFFKLMLFLEETLMKRDGLEKRPYDYKTKLNLSNLTKRNDANNSIKMTTFFPKITVTKACSHYKISEKLTH